MKDYAEWAAEQIEKDYPGYSWDFYMHLVTDTTICTSMERYTVKRYLEGKDGRMDKDKDGIAYNIDGKAFTDDGDIWYTSGDSRVNVTFPYVVPDKPEYVYRNKEDV